MVFQLCIGVKLLVATVTAVLVVSWEVLALHVAKGSNLRVCYLSTQLALKLSLSCIPRYMHPVLVQVSHRHLLSMTFFPTCAFLVSQFCVLQYSQNIK